MSENRPSHQNGTLAFLCFLQITAAFDSVHVRTHLIDIPTTLRHIMFTLNVYGLAFR